MGVEKIDWSLLGVEIAPSQQSQEIQKDQKQNVIRPQKYYYILNDIYAQPRDVRYFRYTEYVCPTYK